MKLGRPCILLALLAIACSKEAADPAAPSLHTIQAGFSSADSDTRSRLDFGETEARVLWSRGDAFKMVTLSDGSFSVATYTTQDDGVERATFTTATTLSGRHFTSGYPADVYRMGKLSQQGQDTTILITPIPSRQQAVAGGLEEGLNRAAAYSTSQDADLCFYNMLSCIRFRVDGDCVSQLDSITFDAGTVVAGDASVYFLGGVPTIDFSKKWSTVTVPRSTTITLRGPFEAGQDYCMAMAPATLQAGFSMLFHGGDKQTILKHSSKALTLGRGRIVDFGTIHLGDSWEVEHAELIKYVRQTEGSKKNVIAVLAEGYTQDELDLFEARAKNGIDYLFSVEPYRSYKDYFTVYLFRLPSNESGASVTDGNGNITDQKDTRFGAYWGEDSYGDMRADTSKIRSALREYCPEIRSGELRDKDIPTVLLVNDTRYGGRCTSYSNGWGYSIVPFQRNGEPISWSFPANQAVNPMDDSEGFRATTEEERLAFGRHTGDWRSTLLHEFGGHCYGRLSDEYWSTNSVQAPGKINTHSYPVPYGLNVSGFYDAVPWQQDLLDQLEEWTSLNPDYGRAGIYQGASSSLYFRWRSEPISCMVDNRPYFNTWSRILIVRRILGKAGETFDMEEFQAKDSTFDPVRPQGDASPTRRMPQPRTVLAPEMPMLLPPLVLEAED